MSKKRVEVEGSFYYITTNIYGRFQLFIQPTYILPVIDNLNFYRYKYDFKVIGFVIMPDHLHLLIWPQNSHSISDIMRDFKKYTAVRIIRQAEAENRQDILSAFTAAGLETKRAIRKVWQDSFWEKIVYTERFLKEKLNYMHRNPIRAGIVDDVEQYAYSSYRNYVLDDQSLISIDSDWAN